MKSKKHIAIAVAAVAIIVVAAVKFHHDIYRCMFVDNDFNCRHPFCSLNLANQPSGSSALFID